jgi:outer membrane translocation and assembly module TamA
VVQRQKDEAFAVDNLHLWLTLAKLFALSFGEQEVTEERWNYMHARETERIELLKSLLVMSK